MLPLLLLSALAVVVMVVARGNGGQTGVQNESPFYWATTHRNFSPQNPIGHLCFAYAFFFPLLCSFCIFVCVKNATACYCCCCCCCRRHYRHTAADLLFSPHGTIRRIKIYRDAHGQPKGDALVTYAKPGSVNAAANKARSLCVCVYSV